MTSAADKIRFGAIERAWLWYLLTVLAAVVLFGWHGGGAGYAPGRYFVIHLALLAAGLGLGKSCGAARTRRVAWSLYSIVALPIVFSSIGLVLPGLHPQPYEWTWLHLDRALFGTDPTVALQAVLSPPVTELLQWSYSSFYFLPIAAIVGSGLCRGGRSYDDAMGLCVFALLLSYLGYFLWPTLPPYRFLPHEPLQDLWVATSLRSAIDAVEINHWDCFPSGHTMLSVLSLVVAWRNARFLFWVLLPVVALLVLSTVALRYHFVCDVIAGLIGVPLALGLWRRIAAPRAVPAAPAATDAISRPASQKPLHAPSTGS